MYTLLDTISSADRADIGLPKSAVASIFTTAIRYWIDPMDERVAKLRTLEDCERVAKNVLERNRPDQAEGARKRALELRADACGANTQVERDCLEAVYAYEAVLTAKNGRKIRASTIWQMVNRHGVLRAVERAVKRDAETVHYAALRTIGLQDYAFEAVVMRHPELFSRDTVQRSKARVNKWKRISPIRDSLPLAMVAGRDR